MKKNRIIEGKFAYKGHFDGLMAQLSLYVHKGGLKPDSFHFDGLNDSIQNKSVQVN